VYDVHGFVPAALDRDLAECVDRLILVHEAPEHDVVRFVVNEKQEDSDASLQPLVVRVDVVHKDKSISSFLGSYCVKQLVGWPTVASRVRS
jgi:hypothetical protein